MTPEAQQIAIAEWCGMVWYRHPVGRSDNRVYRFLAFPGVQEYEGQSEQWKVRADMTEGVCRMDYMAKEFHLPDYLKDLNAINEAVLKLNDRHKFTDDTRSMFYDYLALGAERFPDKWEISWHCTIATAAQRAEALLRTIGLWDNHSTVKGGEA